MSPRQPLPPLPPLPIDDVLEPVLDALREHGRLALIAPPGAGKTTRVPPALLDAGLAGKGNLVYVLQPRRLAARMAAARVAEERGEALGQTVGYEVRFDRRVSAATRISFITEGVLLRKLSADPLLADAGAVLIDEFHERHLAGDLALAMVRALRRGPRPDLCVAVMSATLDTGPVADFLADEAEGELSARRCPVVESHGRVFPVDIEYAPDNAPGREHLPLPRRVAAALRTLARQGLCGDVLVFLPGAAEIRATMEACAELARAHELELLPLHGDLPSEEQDRAVARSSRRKVVLATNVAETSITIDGVAYVIDSGLARMARHSPWSGLPSLRLESISRASAAQRAGRAGRTQSGRCIRLYHRHDHDHFRAFDPPEVERADLADAALLLHASGVPRLRDFAWFEPPPEASMDAADRLLARLGAVDEHGALTDIGRRMLRFPVHPRQARMLVEAEERGVTRDACTLVALLGQRELRASRRTSVSGERAPARAHTTGPSDLLEDLDALAALAAGKRGNARIDARAARAHGLDPAVVAAVRRASERLARLCRPRREPPAGGIDAHESALLAVTLAGYPDRVARRRAPGKGALLFAGGGSALLAPSSVVREAEFLVALDAGERDPGRAGRPGDSPDARVLVTRASAIDPAWLFDLYIDDISERDELEWNPASERVERVSEISYHGLLIDQTRDPRAARDAPEEAARLLADAAWRAGVERFVERDAWRAWCARVHFVNTHTAGADAEPAGAADLANEADEAVLREALASACYGATSFAELERISLMDVITARTGRTQREALDRLAPTHVALPGRKRVPVHYELDRPPWIESRLQDFFGLDTGPRVAGGRVPLVLHLLAPNRRAVQITSDLAGFFDRHYPAVRRELMRRYPRHAWPEDPRKQG